MYILLLLLLLAGSGYGFVVMLKHIHHPKRWTLWYNYQEPGDKNDNLLR